MKRPLLLLVIVTVAILLPHRSAAALPDCADGVPQPREDRAAIYPVGMATDPILEDAHRKAVLNAARQIVEYVGVTMGETGRRVQSEVEARLTDELKYSSDHVPLKGSVIDAWCVRQVTGGYQVFVRVRYPREPLDQLKARLVQEQAQRIAEARINLSRGDRHRQQGDVVPALQAFALALSMGRQAGRSDLVQAAQDRMISLRRSLTIAIRSGDGQRAGSGNSSLEPLVVQVSLHLEGEDLPVVGFPVRFHWEEGEPVQHPVTVATDAQGIAQLSMTSLQPSLSPGLHRIRAGLEWDALPLGLPATDSGLLTSHANDAQMIFTLKVIPTPRYRRVLILISEENLGHSLPESIVAQALSQQLMEAGFRVVADQEIGKSNRESLDAALSGTHGWLIRPDLYGMADLVVAGRVSTRIGSRNLGLAHSTHADAFIRVIELRHGTVVAQRNVDSVGFGDSRELAGIRAIQEAARVVAPSLSEQLVLLEEEPNVSNP